MQSSSFLKEYSILYVKSMTRFAYNNFYFMLFNFDFLFIHY